MYELRNFQHFPFPASLFQVRSRASLRTAQTTAVVAASIQILFDYPTEPIIVCLSAGSQAQTGK